MKVVQELVAYFDRRGQLSKKEVRQLLDKGYLAADAPPHMLELGHAGLVKAGESAVVKVTVMAPLAQYQGCVRNGVTSHDFGRYGSAYRLSAI
jgi:hypothetical protein